MDGVRDEPFGAIVVGSGCAGAWAARELCSMGVRTLLLEAGPERSAGDVPARNNARARKSAGYSDGFNLDGAGAGDLSDVNRETEESQHVQRTHPSFAARGPHLFIDDSQHPYRNSDGGDFRWIRSRQVGGRSLVWGGTALRLSRYELEQGRAELGIPRWPLAYSDLEPWYGRVERALEVVGTPDDLAQLPAGTYAADPGYKLTPAETDLVWSFGPDAATRPTYPRFVPASRRESGWPLHTMQATVLREASATGRLELRPGSHAYRIEVDSSSGLATGVSYVDVTTGLRHFASGRMAFVCCGAIESARLMLNSASERHPAGLGNRSGWLGRGLMDHPVMSACGVLRSYSVLEGFDWSARQRGVLIPPGIDTVSGGNELPFALWVTLQRLSDRAFPLGNIDAQGEMAPSWSNRVTLSNELDEWGVPIPVIECRYGDAEQRMADSMRSAIAEVARAAGLHPLRVSAGLSAPGLNCHELGTARMGASPSESVVDRDNRCWDCRNVFVTDGAAFPAGGWQNPTLTIMAMSARAANLAARQLSGR